MTQNNNNKIHPIAPLPPSEGLEELARELLEGKPAGNAREIPPVTDITNPQDYILLKGRTHGRYSYPDLLVCKYKLGLSPKVETAAKTLSLSVQNTAKETNGREYIGNINWNQGLSLALTLGGQVLPLREFADFLLMLKSGKASNGKGESIKKQELENLLSEITQVREPWRAEWLDADFKYLDKNGNLVAPDKKGNFHIFYNHELKNGILVPKYKEALEPCLMTNCKIALASMNNRGMPTQEGNDFNYWAPLNDNNSVAGFGAGSDGADLYCHRYPLDSDSALGVRLVVRKKISG